MAGIDLEKVLEEMTEMSNEELERLMKSIREKNRDAHSPDDGWSDYPMGTAKMGRNRGGQPRSAVLLGDVLKVRKKTATFQLCRQCMAHAGISLLQLRGKDRWCERDF